MDACALGGLDRARLYPYTRVSSCHETPTREPEEEDKEENGVLPRTSSRNVEGVRDEGHRGGTWGKTHKLLVFDRDCCASAVLGFVSHCACPFRACLSATLERGRTEKDEE